MTVVIGEIITEVTLGSTGNDEEEAASSPRRGGRTDEEELVRRVTRQVLERLRLEWER